MELVKTEEKKYQDYLKFIDKNTEIEIEYFAKKLKGKKVAMINATDYGGGVAEILHSLVPLFQNIGIYMDWWKIRGSDEFFAVTKEFHNGLQGKEGELSGQAKEIYLKYNQMNAESMNDWDYHYVVVHDPQPAAMIDYRNSQDRSKWIWRCHIDTFHPNQEYWSFLSNYVKRYDATVFTMADFAAAESRLPNVTFITPSIDPLSPKNISLTQEEAKIVLHRFRIDTARPLICQVSRFDPWKDPLGVIEAYKIVKKEFPSVQLALVGSMASDDPEGWDYLFRTLRRAGEDYDISIITNFNGVSNLEVNAFQRLSDILVQKSLREGFGLTVSEGLWKGTPVIGGNTGGIRLQIEHGVNGFLVDSVEECADYVLTLLRNPATLGQSMSEAGREKVRQSFLTTTHLLKYLQLFDSLE